MRDIIGDHLGRLRTTVLKKHTAASIAKWIAENTKLGGQPYSFDEHEYQEKILGDTSREKVIRKCSQVGLSEASAREALALVNVLTPYTVAYTLPTANFAGVFAKTRMDPIIEGSDVMKGNVHKTNNNNEIKQFGESFLYIRGAASSNSPISIPVDHLMHDEVDFSDQEVLGQYISRITHSKWKRITKISTPTLPNFGIDLAFKESRRHFNMVKCNHCNFYFVPDYFEHVKIPGYFEDLRTIRKNTLPRIHWEKAALRCPKCDGIPDLGPKRRHWVCENPKDNHVASGYQVTPFDAPKIISTSYLVEASTKYNRLQDFVNFNLGLPMEDSEATLNREDFQNVFQPLSIPGSVQYVMGVDVGAVYHFVIGAVDPYDGIVVVHTEMVPMGNAKRRYRELKAKYGVICSVIDSTPHAETVMTLQAEDYNLYASVYMRSRSILTHNVVEKEGAHDKGQEFVRQVNVNRSRAFDGYMEFLREGHLVIKEPEDKDEKELIIVQHMSMKRVKTYEAESGEMLYSWQKSDGNDHYHHAFLYMWIASKIRGVGKGGARLPLVLLKSFPLKVHV